MPINSFENYHMSWKPDKSKLKKPYYQSLLEKLEQDILSGELQPNVQLPPQRELADYLDLHLSTITQVYKAGKNKGLIYGITGKGTFVSPHSAKPIAIISENFPESCIDLGHAASFDSTDKLLITNMQSTLNSFSSRPFLQNNNLAGTLSQRMIALSWLSRLGVNTDPDHILISSGALNSLSTVLCAVFKPGDTIIVDVFTYANFIEMAKLYYIHLIPVACDDEGMLPEKLEYVCQHNHTKGIFLMPSCTNPSTTFYSNRRKLELANIIKKYKLIVLEDDILAAFTVGEVSDYKQPFFALLPEQTIYICATSKSICFGLRVAFVAFGERFRQKILHSFFIMNVKAASFDIETITGAINTGIAQQILQEKKRLAQISNIIFSY